MKLTLYILTALYFSSAGILRSQDRLFTYTYQSTVLNKEQREIEVSNTFRLGHDDFYQAFDHRIEFETGLGSRLQTSFYLNISNQATVDSTTDWSITPAGSLVPMVNSHIVRSTFLGFSNEWKLQISDPVSNRFGSAFYGEFSYSSTETEIEGKIIIDKITGRICQAINLVIEPEWEQIILNGKVSPHREFEFGFDYGLSYDSGKDWNIGLEIRNINNYDHSSLEPWEYSSFFAGPVIAYHTEKFWVNFTFLPQITGYTHAQGEWKKQLILDEQVRTEARLMFSYAL